MKSVGEYADCYGCGTCSLVCSKVAIKIEENSLGFLHPIVDKTRCVECGLCLNTCSFHQNVLSQANASCSAYAAYSNDIVVRTKCSSGGIGYELAKSAILNGYKFCGVRYNKKTHRAEHYVADKINEIAESCGSKYLQSYTIDAFSKFQKGQQYLVVGTPCQIDSLRRYLRSKKMEQDFILVDFFCHGVPSSLMWKRYEHEYGIENPTEVRWRDKRTGWHDSWNMVFKNKQKETSSLMSKGDLFYKFFLRNRCLGKACYDDCKYKMISSAADIRIGDLWGTKYQSDEVGISGVIAFTLKGENLLHQLKACTIIPETLAVVTESQMKKCAVRPSSYNYVMEALKTKMSLNEIDKKASRKEWLLDTIPAKTKYYSRRIIEKTVCSLKR